MSELDFQRNSNDRPLEREGDRVSVGFIYPMWMSAKMNLIDALYARKKDSEIFEIVDAWMKRHFFELGITTQVDAMDLYKNEEEFEKHIKYMAARKLSDEILKTNLYMREIVSNRPKSKYAYHHPERIYTYTMIVGGVPLLTGPGTREAKLLKIEDAFSPSVSPP